MGKSLSRVGIVGASSLVGKELAEELHDSVLGVVDVVLLDEDAEGGRVTAAGDEAAFVQRVGPGSFDGMELCFFAGHADETMRHWAAAVGARVGVIDMSNALTGKDGVVVRSPWLPGGGRLGLGVNAVVPAHPVAVMLGLVTGRCAGLGLSEVAATVLEPASERGASGMDEMHRQTVSLLSFQNIPRVEFDAQVAFNLLPELGPMARVSMTTTTQRILADYGSAGGTLAGLSLQMVHAPVFHGYAVSAVLDFHEAVTTEAVEEALAGEHVEVLGLAEEAPSNVSATSQGQVLVRVSPSGGRRVWVWMTADNLKLGALHAIACAAEFEGVRPRGKVQ